MGDSPSNDDSQSRPAPPPSSPTSRRSELTPEMSAAQAGWSQARMDAAADAEIGLSSSPPVASGRSATSIGSGGGDGATVMTPARSAATTNSGGVGGGGGGGSGRPNSASSAFSTGGATGSSKLPALRLSASELVNQLQAESSPSPRMPTTPASGSRGR